MNDMELMQQALEALDHFDDVDKTTAAIAALRERLAQPVQTVSMDEYKRLQDLVTSQGIRLMEYESKQEPVAWSVLDKRRGKHWYTHESKYTAQYYANLYSHREPDGSPSMVVTPLYAAPPKRKWVGLTDEEKKHIENRDFMYGVEWAEAKLWEKNA